VADKWVYLSLAISRSVPAERRQMPNCLCTRRNGISPHKSAFRKDRATSPRQEQRQNPIFLVNMPSVMSPASPFASIPCDPLRAHRTARNFPPFCYPENAGEVSPTAGPLTRTVFSWFRNQRGPLLFAPPSAASVALSHLSPYSGASAAKSLFLKFVRLTPAESNACDSTPDIKPVNKINP
jgi:hypothetical protein